MRKPAVRTVTAMTTFAAYATALLNVLSVKAASKVIPARHSATLLVLRLAGPMTPINASLMNCALSKMSLELKRPVSVVSKTVGTHVPGVMNAVSISILLCFSFNSIPFHSS